jgi:hypothetical protein
LPRASRAERGGGEGGPNREGRRARGRGGRSRGGRRAREAPSRALGRRGLSRAERGAGGQERERRARRARAGALCRGVLSRWDKSSRASVFAPKTTPVFLRPSSLLICAAERAFSRYGLLCSSPSPCLARSLAPRPPAPASWPCTPINIARAALHNFALPPLIVTAAPAFLLPP